MGENWNRHPGDKMSSGIISRSNNPGGQARLRLSYFGADHDTYRVRAISR